MWFFLFKQKKEDEMRISDCSSDVCASDRREDDRDDHADDGDGGVLAAEIGLRAFLDGGGDVLHLLVASGRAQHLLACDETVDDGTQAARDRSIDKRPWLTLPPRHTKHGNAAATPLTARRNETGPATRQKTGGRG